MKSINIGKEYIQALLITMNGATVNIITTSEGGDNDNALSGNRNAFAYNAISGTISTDDCYSGEKAALIRTVGWGAGNSAAASSWGSGFGTCKNVTAGELFLGTLNPVLTACL